MNICNSEDLCKEIRKRLLEKTKKDTVASVKGPVDIVLYKNYVELVDIAIKFVNPVLKEVFDDYAYKLVPEKVDILIDLAVVQIFKLLRTLMDGMSNLQTYGISKGLDELYLLNKQLDREENDNGENASYY